MQHKRYTILFIFMFVIAFALSNNIANKDVLDTDAKYSTGFLLNSFTGSNLASQTESVLYIKNGIKGEYPRITSGGSEDEIRKWNEVIVKDFNKILKQYSFEPELGPSVSPFNPIPVILNISYDLKRNDTGYISILYRAAFNSPYSAHPTELVYTTNIDKATGARLQLKDIIELDHEFVKQFRTWSMNQADGQSEEFNKAIKDYVAGLSDDDLLMGFESADIIGTGNLWGIYSYLTDDKLGISLGVPNYIGDHVEFQKEYSKLGKFLKTRF